MPPIRTITARILNRVDTESDWQSRNPLLGMGEFALANVGLDRIRIKIGTGNKNFNDLPYYDESAGAYQGLASTSIVPNVSSGKVWYFAGPGTYTNFIGSNSSPIVVSVPLAILSFDNGYWYKLDVIENDISYVLNRVIVKSGGTPSVDCDYTSIISALSGITTNSENNRYIIEVLPGEYVGDISHSKDYIDIIGSPMNTGKVIVINTAASSALNEPTTRTITISARCNIRNISFYGYRCQTIMFFRNQLDTTREVTFQDCEFKHFGGQGSEFTPIVVFPYYNQKVNFINCTIDGGENYISNHSSNTYRDNSSAFNVSLVGCKISSLRIDDYLQYSRDRIEMYGNVIDKLTLNAETAFYTSTPGNSLSNRGFYPPLIQLKEYGNIIRRVDYLNQYISINDNRRKSIIGYSKPVTNSDAIDTISKGAAVIRVANIALPNTYSPGDEITPSEQVELYSGSGRIYGFVEADILPGEIGSIIEANRDNIIYGKFDNVNGSLLLGDEVEVTSSGLIAKKSAGSLFGYATEADSGGYVRFQKA